ncbi:Hypothetical predicted protein [Pelobates cultripes]|uniref:MyoD family inhibitor domain containing n=1 Tax=Pelobates cultripes TaxID=61616 RepID=A0AAD1R0N0_PELCU|nr:Hypothetical predicted protein [Pelobates cultripes]
MFQDINTPTPAPCSPSHDPGDLTDTLISTQDEELEQPEILPSNNESPQQTVATESPIRTYTLISTQDEALEQPKILPSNNESPPQTVVTESPKRTYTLLSRQDGASEQSIIIPSFNGSPQQTVDEEIPKTTHSLRSPMINSAKITNGSSFLCNSEIPKGYNHQTKGPKKSSSQNRLEKQTSKASNEGSQSPSLPPGYEKDCCVHCTLALLFCQFLSLCNLLLDVLTCGSCSVDSSEFCCSCCSIEGCPDCSDSCGTDCGIVDACCESADCLEICMECCGLCFSN